MRTAKTASVCLTPNAAGPRFTAQVRELDNSRTYLGRHETREAALAACARYIETGERPPPLKRGIKLGQKKRTKAEKRAGLPKIPYDPPTLLTDRQPVPHPTAERLARIGATDARQAPATPVSALAPGRHSGQSRHEAPARPTMTPEQRAERLEMMKRVWRRGE